MIPPPPSGPTLVIEDINFHDATNSTLVGEGQVHSAGGTMFVAIRNAGTTSELITKLTINGTALADLTNLKWWRQQPPGYVAPGQVVSILAHVAGSPVTENASVTVAAECLSGQTAGALTKTGSLDVSKGATFTAPALTEVTGDLYVSKGATFTAPKLKR